MNVRYKCECMLVEREIAVTPRVKGSDIADWFENVVQNAVSYDHRANHPKCRSKKTEFIKIPMSENTEEIGVEAVVN